jgi:tetratricopeptide (TPR) repeat protein
MKNIKVSEQLQSELDELAEEGNKYFDNNEYDKALEIWKRALDLIPEPKKRISETVWFLTSIGDIYFLQGKYEEAFDNFEDARNNLSGEGINNPFILLRLGQSAFELEKKELATENLLRAYMLEGKEIFEEDDKKYFEFLKSNVDLDSK